MPPVLEITPEMVGPNRTDMTRAYLIAVMQWPEDSEQRREVMKTAAALHLRSTIGTVPAARDAIADNVDLITIALDSLPPRMISRQGESRYYQGVLAGEFLGAAVVSAAAGIPFKLEAFKAGMTAERRRKVHPKLNISRSTLDNTILPRFRPVAHFWAAYTYEAMHGTDRLFPCSLARVPEFLAMAEFFRERALSLRFPQRRDALARAEEMWTLPPGLPLPRCELVTV